MYDDDQITDLRHGIYRRQYSGFIDGRRLNQLSLQAEAWFWRVHAVADDFGNQPGDPFIVYRNTVGRRFGQVSQKQVAGYVREMIQVGLVVEYEVKGEKYLHLIGFTEKQPKGRNGKPICKVPNIPSELVVSTTVTTPGESKGIQNNPDDSSAPIPTPTPTTKQRGIDPTGFVRFWDAWPTHRRKDDRKSCLRHWQANDLEEKTPQILAGLANWKASEDWRKDNGKYIPAPLVWLRKERWAVSMKTAGLETSELSAAATKQHDRIAEEARKNAEYEQAVTTYAKGLTRAMVEALTPLFLAEAGKPFNPNVWRCQQWAYDNREKIRPNMEVQNVAV